MTNAESHALQESARWIESKCRSRPEIGIVLGSGLGEFANRLQESVELAWSEVPHMPTPTVPGHAGKLVLGTIAGVSVACLQGRVHLYEGHPAERVAFGVRLLAELGCKAVLLTNAAGAVAVTLEPGDLLLIVDHINLTGQSPLTHPSGAASPRFIDMSRAYDPHIAEAARQAARESKLRLNDGVYAAVTGPAYETPAEVHMLNVMGAHAVGMSTALEVLALRERDVRVGAISIITNRGAGLPGAILDHEHVRRIAGMATDQLTVLMQRWIQLVKRDCLEGAAGESQPQ